MKDSMDTNGQKKRRDPKQEPLIPKHGGYRKLKSFQMAQLVYDITVRFCDRYIDKRSRTHDQMVQAARSGVQNIAEGSQVSGTSKKMEMKLTNVARASLEELKLDYEDFLRQRGLTLWAEDDPLRTELIRRRCEDADAVAEWVREVYQRERSEENRKIKLNTQSQKNDPMGKSIKFIKSIPSKQSIYPEITANAAITLIVVTCSLLDRQIASQAESFETEGGFTERLYQRRKTKRLWD